MAMLRTLSMSVHHICTLKSSLLHWVVPTTFKSKVIKSYDDINNSAMVVLTSDARGLKPNGSVEKVIQKYPYVKELYNSRKELFPGGEISTKETADKLGSLKYVGGERPTLCIVINKTHHKSKDKAWKNAALQHSSTKDEDLKLQLKHQEHLREYHEMIALEKFLENCQANKPSEVILYLGPLDENNE